jgi:hypothetical protein
VEAAQRAVAVSDEETGSNEAGEREQGLIAGDFIHVAGALDAIRLVREAEFFSPLLAFL